MLQHVMVVGGGTMGQEIALACAVLNGSSMPMAEGLRYENRLAALVFGTRDKREGLSAFLEKRKPQFTGE